MFISMIKKILLIFLYLRENKIYRLIKHSLVYGIGNIIQRFLSIILLPIYTRYLTPADYGIISLLGIFGMIIGTITMCGLTNGIARYFFYTEQENVSLSEVVWSPFVFITLFSIIIITPLALFSNHLSLLLFDKTDYGYLVVLTLIGILISNLSGVGTSILVFQEKAMTVNFINLAGLAVGATSGVFFVVFLKRGITGAVEAGLLGSAIMLIPMMLLTMARYKPTFSTAILKKQLKFSLPLVIAIFAFWFIDSSDRYVLKVFLPLSEVGLYNIGYSIGLTMMIIVGGFTLAWPPYYHKNNQNNEGQALCNNILKIYLLATSFFVVLISLGAPIAVRLLTTEKFYQAYTVTPWVAMAYMLKGPYIIFLLGLLMKNKTTWQLYLEGFAAAVNIGLNILLIPLIGREAAGITTLISYSIMAIGAYLLVKKINPIPEISIGYVSGITVLSFIAATCTLWAADSSSYILLSILIFACFATISLLISYKEFGPLITEKLKYG